MEYRLDQKQRTWENKLRRPRWGVAAQGESHGAHQSERRLVSKNKELLGEWCRLQEANRLLSREEWDNETYIAFKLCANSNSFKFYL